MSSWFSFGGKASEKGANTEPQAVRALPASWYRSEAMYELERRAIFSKKWLLITHKSRFTEDGDYVQVTQAGLSFFLIKDRRGEIRGHHNVCRHRAYPLVHADSGHLRVLACKYHGMYTTYTNTANSLADAPRTGWSYGFDGKLAKAPRYQDIPSFDKTANGLYKIHVHVDEKGFVWVNLDAAEEPIPWEEDFAGVDREPRLDQFDMSKYSYHHSWGMTTNYNWKALADNYNEVRQWPTDHSKTLAHKL